MTPEAKAKEIIEKFHQLAYVDMGSGVMAYTYKARQCAILCVDEILDAIKEFWNGPDWGLPDTMGWQYWNRVKEELQKL